MFAVSVVMNTHEYKELFKEEDSIDILKILGSINNIKQYQKMYNHAWRKHESSI